MARACLLAVLLAASAPSAAGLLQCSATAQCTSDMAVVNTSAWELFLLQAGAAGFVAPPHNKLNAVVGALSASVSNANLPAVSQGCLTCQAHTIICGYAYAMSPCGVCASNMGANACTEECRTCQWKRCSVKEACGGEYGTDVQVPYACATAPAAGSQPSVEVTMAIQTAAEADNQVTCGNVTMPPPPETTTMATASGSAVQGSSLLATVCAAWVMMLAWQ